MNSIIKKIVCLCFSLLAIQALKGQQLYFFYVAPTTQMNATFGSAATQGFMDNTTGTAMMSGYRYVQITSGNLAQFRTLAAGSHVLKTYDSITAATSRLRRKLNKVMSLTGSRVSSIFIFLTDDATALPANTPNFLCPTGGTSSFAWPCASNWKSGANYVGRINLGERAARRFANGPGGFRDWEATVIHEMSHTQMLRDTTGVNKWDTPTTDGIAISYGGDDGHWGFELQADEQTPMDEGLGTFWAIEHAPSLRVELDSFLNNGADRFALGSLSFLRSVPQMWNAPHNVLCNGIPCNFWNGYSAELISSIPPATPYELLSYRWLDVPGEFVLYNEMMSEAYFYLYHQYAFARQDTAFNKIFHAVRTLCNDANQRHRYPAHAANILANSMEAYARTAAGQQESTSGTLVSSMFAYALLDLMGHFHRTDDDLRREFDINSATYIHYTPKPRAYQHYFTHRAAVKQEACQYLGGNNCAAGSTGAIDIHRAVVAVRDYFKNSTRILQ